MQASGQMDSPEFGDAPESFGRQALKRFFTHRLAIVGLLMLVILVGMFWIGPIVSPYEFDEINIPDRAQSPSRSHIFGTDDLGRDLFVRAMTGGQFSIRISVTTALLTTMLGGIFGILAGYFGKLTDTLVSFMINVMLTINALAVLVVIGVRVEMTPLSMAVLIAVLSWYRGGRVVRALTMQLREREFVLAARAAGASSRHIMWRHVLPNVAGALLVEATLLAGTAIILESTLSFLGLGVQPPNTTLGTLINDGKGLLDTRPYRVLIPGGLIILIVLALNFVGDGLRDALDPTHEGSD